MSGGFHWDGPKPLDELRGYGWDIKNRGTCRSCGDPILWAITHKGSWCPLTETGDDQWEAHQSLCKGEHGNQERGQSAPRASNQARPKPGPARGPHPQSAAPAGKPNDATLPLVVKCPCCQASLNVHAYFSKGGGLRPILSIPQ